MKNLRLFNLCWKMSYLLLLYKQSVQWQHQLLIIPQTMHFTGNMSWLNIIQEEDSSCINKIHIVRYEECDKSFSTRVKIDFFHSLYIVVHHIMGLFRLTKNLKKFGCNDSAEWFYFRSSPVPYFISAKCFSKFSHNSTQVNLNSN